MAGKRQASTPRKSYWDGRWALVCFGAFARGVRGTKKAFGGFGGLDGWQTAGFNAKKKLFGWALVPFPAGKRQAFAPRKAIRMGLGAFWMVCVNAKKKILGWAMGFGAFACGVRGTKKAFGGFEGVLRGRGFWWASERLTAGKRQASTPRKSYWDVPWCLCLRGWGYQRVWSV